MKKRDQSVDLTRAVTALTEHLSDLTKEKHNTIAEEMQKLQKIIQPTIGIFTNIGKAHASGFQTQEQKIQEKLSLFKNCEVIDVIGNKIESILQNIYNYFSHYLLK